MCSSSMEACRLTRRPLPLVPTQSSGSLARRVVRSLTVQVSFALERLQKIVLSCFTVIFYAFSKKLFSKELLTNFAVFDEENPNGKLLGALATLGVDLSQVEISLSSLNPQGRNSLPRRGTLLQKAVQAGAPDLFYILLPHIDVNIKLPPTGDSLLHAAVCKEILVEKENLWKGAAKALMEKGADPNLQNDYGMSAAHYIATEITRENRAVCVDLFTHLIKAGANLYTEDRFKKSTWSLLREKAAELPGLREEILAISSKE